MQEKKEIPETDRQKKARATLKKIKTILEKEIKNITEDEVRFLARLAVLNSANPIGQKIKDELLQKTDPNKHQDSPDLEKATNLTQIFNEAISQSSGTRRKSVSLATRLALDSYNRVMKDFENKEYNKNSLIEKKLFLLLCDLINTVFNNYIFTLDPVDNYSDVLEEIIKKFGYEKDSNEADSIRQIGKLKLSLHLSIIDNPLIYDQKSKLEPLVPPDLHLSNEFSNAKYRKISGERNASISNFFRPYIEARKKSLESLFSVDNKGITAEELEKFNQDAAYHAKDLRNNLMLSQPSDGLSDKILYNAAILFCGFIVFGGAVLLARAAYTKLRYGEFYSFGTSNVLLHYKHNAKVQEEAGEAAEALSEKTRIRFFKSDAKDDNGEEESQDLHRNQI